MSSAKPPALERFDPLLRGLDLPLQRMYFPLGFPLRLATNSPDVLDAAAECWGGGASQFECQPIDLRIVVQTQGDLASPPVYRQQGHLFTIVSNPDNFAVCDFSSLSGCAFLSQKTTADHAWMRWHFLEAMAHASLEQRYTVALHAACVARQDTGVLLCGPSGAGKSTLAFACARAGWTYVSDEAVHLLLPAGDDRTVAGNPRLVRFRADARLRFPEFRDIPARVRPNGKVSIEALLADFPQIQTAAQSRIGAVVFLDRRSGASAPVTSVAKSEAVELLLREKPFYGEGCWELHERAVQRLVDAPRYRLQYETVETAVCALCDLIPAPGR